MVLWRPEEPPNFPPFSHVNKRVIEAAWTTPGGEFEKPPRYSPIDRSGASWLSKTWVPCHLQHCAKAPTECLSSVWVSEVLSEKQLLRNLLSAAKVSTNYTPHYNNGYKRTTKNKRNHIAKRCSAMRIVYQKKGLWAASLPRSFLFSPVAKTAWTLFHFRFHCQHPSHIPQTSILCPFSSPKQRHLNE